MSDTPIGFSSQPIGPLVQVANAVFSAVATGTTVLPHDDTIPQNTEGDQYMTLAITPKNTNNILIIDADFVASHSSSVAEITGALFQDTTANALAAKTAFMNTATGEAIGFIRHTMTAGTTASTTFKVRIGCQNVGTTTFNGQGGGRLFGGITLSSMVIWEYRP